MAKGTEAGAGTLLRDMVYSLCLPGSDASIPGWGQSLPWQVQNLCL